MGRGSRRLIGIAVIATSMVVAATCVRTNRVACDDGTFCPEGATCGTFEGASICVFDTQSCGNEVVDAALGEECDDGGPPRSGDGCSSTCKAERPVWRDVGALISPRISFGVATDPVSGTILFGGAVGSAASDVPLFGSLDETWKWDGGEFERLEPVTRPPRRADFAMAYLGGGPGGGGRVVVFGGVGVDGKLLDDTWLWDGYDWFGGTGSMPHDELWAYNGQWSMLPQGVSRPSVRFRHAMTYDVQRGVIVLVGGTNGVGPLQDTWELSGPCDAPTWQQVATTGPPPRASSAMAFDERRGVSVLFGGSGAGGDLDDTWEWDGIAWTQRAPASASGPEPRSSHALVYDRRRGRVVMFGGSRSNLKLADTWEWRSTDESWGRVPAVVDLPARSGMSFAEDVTGGILAIAGAGPTPSSTSLPTYRLTWQDGPVERCRLPDEDLDGDGLAGCDDPDCRGRCAPTCPIETAFALCPAPSCGDGVLQPVEDPHLCPDDR